MTRQALRALPLAGSSGARVGVAVCALLCAAGCAGRPLTFEALEAEVARERAAIRALELEARPGTGQDAAPPAEAETALAFYQTDRPRLVVPPDTEHAAESRALARRLSDEGIRGFAYTGESARVVCEVPCSEGALEQVPLRVLYAARFAAARELRGAELDVIVRREQQGVLVTLWHEPDGRLRAADAPRVRLPQQSRAALTAPAAAELTLLHGLGGIDAGSREWAPHERDVLGLALSLLSKREIELLAGRTFRREHAAVDAVAGGGGCVYGRVPDPERIDIYDVALAAGGAGFEGVLRSPYPSPAHGVLHQIGHVLVHATPAPLAARVEEHRVALERVRKRLRRLRNRAGAAGQERSADLADEIDMLEKSLDRLSAARREPRVEDRALDRFARVLPAGSGATPYGRTSLEESFAEAFALCRLDAEACHRISRPLLEFFSSERHLPRR